MSNDATRVRFDIRAYSIDRKKVCLQFEGNGFPVFIKFFEVIWTDPLLFFCRLNRFSIDP